MFEIKFKRIKFGFADMMFYMFIALVTLICSFFVHYAVTFPPSDEIVDEHYKGNRILVKEYKREKIKEADTTKYAYILKSYPRPKEYKLKVIKINDWSINVKFENNEIYRASVNDPHKYKKGQTITATKVYYPKKITTIKGEEKTEWVRLNQ